MIVFYNKETGDIVGTIDGRLHGPDHLNMFMGNPDETERIICQWRPVKWYDGKGNEIDSNKEPDRIMAADFEPNHAQKDIFMVLDKNPNKIHDYKVDIASKQLVLKNANSK